MSWDNTTLFVDDDPADRAFRAGGARLGRQNLPAELCNRPARIDPPELKPWHRKLYERGWIAPHWPKQYGGMGATLTQQIILFEEISRVGAPTPYPHGLSFIGPLIIDAGTPAQKAQHLPPILTGDVDLVPGLFGDRRRLRPRQPDDARRARRRRLRRQRPQDLDHQRPLRRLDVRAGAHRPEGAAAPRRHHHAADRPEVARRHRRPIQTIKGDAEFAEELFVERARAAREPARRAQRRLARRQQPARLRALHHRPSAQRRGLSQPGATGGRAHRRDPRAVLPATAGDARDRPARVLGLSTATPPRCTRTARRRPRWRR